ncbi:MAG: hypothetical protein GY702_00025 [Desulfobulbaceae bacterium]|nr:hypothetical protein [Desulfobulbaceae bacterium]
MADQKSVVPVKLETAPEAGRDPLMTMIEIAKDKELSDSDKSALISYSQQRFTNRRRMAYVALYSLIASLGFLLIAAFIDGFRTCPTGQTCEGILKSIENSQTLIIWIEGFLTAIVAAYYGVSAWRPAS